MNQVVTTVKGIISKMNDYGIPLPLLRIDGKPTLTGTMCFLAFNNALLGQLGKLAGFVGGLDLNNANYLFLTTAGIYLGRKMQSKGDTKGVDLEAGEGKQ